MDDLLKELGDLARREEGTGKAYLDERWDRLAAGTLTAEEEKELKALAASSPEAWEAYEAFRPLGVDFQTRMTDLLRQALAGDQSRDAEDTADLIRRALARDQTAETRLVARLTHVIHARVARTLLTYRSLLASGRDLREEIKDQVQEVFLKLFVKDGRVLRAWQPRRGLSLENFVGLVAKRSVIAILRSNKKNPWKEELSLDEEEFDFTAPDNDPEELAANRELLSLLLNRLREELSPLGLYMFDLLFVQELSQEEVEAVSDLSSDAVYAWRSRLRRLVRKLNAEISRSPVPPRKT